VAILIDDPRWPAHGRLWAHLVSDHDLDELHAFARQLGLERERFQNKTSGAHYDVPAPLREEALRLGAVAIFL